jgi:glycosyltransferase involved in cell wall biosynthesis
MITIAQFPAHSEINPVLDLFADGLTQAGVRILSHQVLPGQPQHFAPWLRQHATELDVVHLHWFQRLYLRGSVIRTALALMRLRMTLRRVRRSGVKLTWTVHNIRPHESPYPRLDTYAARTVARLADAVFVECPAAVPEVVEAFPSAQGRIRTIASGAYTEVYQRRVPLQSARRTLGLSARRKVFVSFGLIRRYKRVPELIETFSRTFPNGSAVLLVAGEPCDDDERRRILAAASGAADGVVLRLERVIDDDVPVVLAAADFVVCNYADPFNSGVIMLAATFGRPVIAPQVGTARSLPQEMIVPIAQHDEGLADALRSAVDRDCVAAGNAAAAWVSERTWAQSAGEVADVWQELTRHGRRAGA